MTPLRWTATLAGMFFGYYAGGPVGGLAGLALGWWMGRPRAQAQPAPASDSRLNQAYRTLGLQQGASEDSVRTAYRRLMNRSHPDKLAANGATEAELKGAQQEAHEIRKAYDLIRKRKG